MARRVVNIIRNRLCSAPVYLAADRVHQFGLKLFGISPNANDRRVTEEEIRMLVDVGVNPAAFMPTRRNDRENL